MFDSGLTFAREQITFDAKMQQLLSSTGILPSLSIGLGRRVLRPFAWLLAFVILFVSTLAEAAPFAPPPLAGHVVDPAGALTEMQAHRLDLKLDRARRQTGFAIIVYVMPQLPEGMSIEDVGYAAGNAWGVGSKAGDDGILLLAALADRKLRIETGKGAGGALTDVQSSHIIRDVIAPLMKEGRTYEAMDRGASAIVAELLQNAPSEPGRDPAARRNGAVGAGAKATVADYVKMGVIGLVLIGVIVLAIVSPTFREILFWLLLFGRFGGGGGSGDRGGGGGGSGYGGGGGRFGGGGSSDDY